jgi:hypothetical protein
MNYWDKQKQQDASISALDILSERFGKPGAATRNRSMQESMMAQTFGDPSNPAPQRTMREAMLVRAYGTKKPTE